MVALFVGSAHVYTLALLGGSLCLDFANTLDPRHGEHRREFLMSYQDLVAWGRHVGVLQDSDVTRLLQRSAKHREEASAIFERALALRETIYRIFSAITQGERPADPDLVALRDAYLGAIACSRIAAATDRFELEWVGVAEALDPMLWPVARSAFELLIAGDLDRVRECPGVGDCGWLFLDTSKNASRRWCSMEGCGSRAKMRRQYARKRKAGPGTTG